MILDYFYGQAGELFSFFRIPKALFQEHSNDEELNRELFEQTVKQVILQPDGSIKFQLLNGKIV